MKVDVYRNLHKGCMSVRSRERESYGRVIAHAKFLKMVNCKFVVNPGGRAKVLKSRKKNVHAFVRGTICEIESKIPDVEVDNYIEVTYNPYRYDKFVTLHSQIPIGGAKEVLITNNKVYAKKIWCI